MIPPSKILFYIIEFINSYAAIYYSNFLFFYLRRTFGFGEGANLLTAAMGGIVYIVASWQCGKWVHRGGALRILALGLCTVIFALALGLAVTAPSAQVLVFGLWTVGICLIWPTLEMLVGERSGRKLSKMVGMFNVTWAASGAIAYFTAGLLIEKLGIASVFWLPLGLTIVELAIVPFAAKQRAAETGLQDHETHILSSVHPADSKRFLQMAWIANPFSYVAINTVIPLIPSIAEKMAFSTGMAGIICSFWMFARLAAFAVFWQWTGWHYRFRWLAGSCLLMIVCFFVFLLTESVMLLLMAQAGFGLSIGLIYSSSLYYSLNVTEDQAKNAGLHEAMIGVGLFIGPAVGAASVFLAPAAHVGAWSVGGLLCIGFSGLVFVRNYRRSANGLPGKK